MYIDQALAWPYIRRLKELSYKMETRTVFLSNFVYLYFQVRGKVYTRISRMSQLSRTENYSFKNQKYSETKNDKD